MAEREVGSSEDRSRETDQSLEADHCRSDWPTDFHMQAYCEQQQLAALKKLKAAGFGGIPYEVSVAIRRHCAGDWPADFHMRDYCEQQQETGYRQTHP
jgi:hypothetical protein